MSTADDREIFDMIKKIWGGIAIVIGGKLFRDWMKKKGSKGK